MSLDNLACLVVVLTIQDTQNGQEQVQHIQVQGNGSSNLFLDVVVAHDHLGIKEDVSREDKSTKNTVYCLHHAAEGQEHGDEAEQNQEPESSE